MLFQDRKTTKVQVQNLELNVLRNSLSPYNRDAFQSDSLLPWVFAFLLFLSQQRSSQDKASSLEIGLEVCLSVWSSFVTLTLKCESSFKWK